jgi:hypothetical protein
MPRIEKKHGQAQVKTNINEQKIFFRINGNLPTELCQQVFETLPSCCEL